MIVVSWASRAGRIDHDGPATLWRQVADDLSEEITTGGLPAGARLPTEVELGAIYGVSRITVRRAVKELVAAGLVVKVHGRGTFVEHCA